MPQSPAPSPLANWGGRAFRVVLGAGAVAGAVTAVIALWPVDEEDFAGFTAVQVRSGVPYDEYEQQIQAPKPLAKSLGGLPVTSIRLVAVAPEPNVPEDAIATPTRKLTETSKPTSTATSKLTATSPATPTKTSTAPPTKTSTRTSTGRPTKTATNSSTAPQKATVNRPWLAPPAFTAENSVKLVRPPDPPLIPLPKINGIKEGCQLTNCGTLVDSMVSVLRPRDSHGALYPAARAAEELKSVIVNSRTVSVGKGRKQILGAVVEVNLELTGLRGQTILLSWSLWRNGGTKQVYASWLNENLAYEFKAGSNHDSASLDFWIPLPKGKGPYVVRSKLSMDGTVLVSKDSEPIT